MLLSKIVRYQGDGHAKGKLLPHVCRPHSRWVPKGKIAQRAPTVLNAYVRDWCSGAKIAPWVPTANEVGAHG